MRRTTNIQIEPLFRDPLSVNDWFLNGLGDKGINHTLDVRRKRKVALLLNGEQTHLVPEEFSHINGRGDWTTLKAVVHIFSIEHEIEREGANHGLVSVLGHNNLEETEIHLTVPW